jgi:hypothetical protein
MLSCYTRSGIQLIYAFTLDKNLAKYTNVISYEDYPKNQLPEDLYTFALNIIRDKLANSKNEVIKKYIVK